MTTHYQIRFKGHLDPTWSEWFESMALTHAPTGETILIGPLADQAALYGLLEKARNLNLTLISVSELHPTTSSEPLSLVVPVSLNRPRLDR